MAPKKKKTKAELEEEQRKAEEEARLAEEERLGQEAEARRRQEELELQRQALVAELLEQEESRTRKERSCNEASTIQRDQTRKEERQRQHHDKEWDRYLACTPLPDPNNRVAMNDLLNTLGEAGVAPVPLMMQLWQDCAHILDDSYMLYYEAVQMHDEQQAAAHMMYIRKLQQILDQVTCKSTANFLLYADEHANEKNEVQMAVSSGLMYWAVWINTNKNPRLKVLDFPQIRVTVEVPKQIALANVALRVQHHNDDKYSATSTDGNMAVGGVTCVALLGLPVPAKKVKHWTLRPVASQALALQRIPYPIPPAGADPATYCSEEEPPPIRVTQPLPAGTFLPQGAAVAVGWWDHASCSWSQQGVSDVVVDKAASNLSFNTTHLGSLALVCNRTSLLPYKSWSIRPTGGRHADTVEVTLETEGAGRIIFEVGPSYAQLQQEVQQQLGSIVHKPMQPLVLLWRLSQLGLPVMPCAADAALAGLQAKEDDVERTMCEDLATLSRAFLVASSRWNQQAGAAGCLCRVSEIVDWEEGGRTELHHVHRIFGKEHEEGALRVLVVKRRGMRGVAFTDALDKRPEYVPPPGVTSVQEAEEAMTSLHGEVHHDLCSLLEGGSRAEQPSPQYAELSSRLRASPEAIQLARDTNPLTIEAVAQLLYGLRVFSCG